MNNQEAIKTLRELWRETNDHWHEAVYDMSISALEKQIPKKPKSVFCPQCGEEFTEDDCWSSDYCRKCGQAIDWEDE